MPLNLRLAGPWTNHPILRKKDKDKDKNNEIDNQNKKPIIEPSLKLTQHLLPHTTFNLPFSQSQSQSQSHHQSPIQPSVILSPLSEPNELSPSPQPFWPELTIAVLHLQSMDDSIHSTIDSRLSSTGFKLIERLTINISPPSASHHSPIAQLGSVAAAGFRDGQNLIYLLSRPRAIQAWKDLVGHLDPASTRANLPARPGSLRAMFGSEVVWAAENVDTVYEIIHRFWPDTDHLKGKQFANVKHLKLQAQTPASPSLASPHLFAFPNQSTEADDQEPSTPTHKPQKRVFKFSNRGILPDSLSPPSLSGGSTHKPLTAPVLELPHSPRLRNVEETSQDLEPLSASNVNNNNSTIHTRPQFTRSHSTHPEIGNNQAATATSLASPLSTPSLEPLPQRSSSSQSDLSPAPSDKSLYSDSGPVESPALSTHSSIPLPPTITTDSTSQTCESFSSSPSLANSVNSDRTTEEGSQAQFNPSNSTNSLDLEVDLPISPAPTLKKSKSPGRPSPGMSGMVSPFRARPLPATNSQPSSLPRMSKAAALRMGLPWTPPPRSVSPNPDSSPLPPRVVPAVASLNPPTVEPRATRASTLRSDSSTPLPSSSLPRVKRSESEIFENTPGHNFRRRSLLLPVASIAEPKQQPRATRASALRAGVEPTPNPGSGARRGAPADQKEIFEGTPGHPRAERFEVKATAPPEVEVRPTRASLLRAKTDGSGSSDGGPACVMRGRAASGTQPKSSLPSSAEETTTTTARRPTFEGVPGHKRLIPVPVAVLQRAPVTAPRSNRAAELRAGTSPYNNNTNHHNIKSRKTSGSAQSSRSTLDPSYSSCSITEHAEEGEEYEYEENVLEEEHEPVEQEGYGTVTILKNESLC
ncbi:hypothetical protein CROQUDRAFT_129948 [Cronartium quercuum f. sp. fusiforme G11]|uniref:Uncharacterized protein n=1 Tax=Cronartium quercuum f. sp. fusiforme G11 TaxID=708437 RepID=A0A9P6NWM4_9BASI|nr:hypothetical protein CROQUDRAFT_129948 [Cronartium quercuum f. sp. fusiforme G11]